MSFVRACFLLLILSFAANASSASVTGPTAGSLGRGVAYFEPPRSVGTPIDDLARIYTGYALADRIAGRLRLDTDASLHPTVRELIRRRLAQGA